MNEIEKCRNSVAYFYNNYLRKVGEPKVSEDYFEKLVKELAILNTVKDTVKLVSHRNWGKSYHYGK